MWVSVGKIQKIEIIDYIECSRWTKKIISYSENNNAISLDKSLKTLNWFKKTHKNICFEEIQKSGRKKVQSSKFSVVIKFLLNINVIIENNIKIKNWNLSRIWLITNYLLLHCIENKNKKNCKSLEYPSNSLWNFHVFLSAT